MTRLCVVHLPSPYQLSWRLALSAVAERKGWMVLDQSQIELLDSVGDVNLLVNCFDADAVELFCPTDTVIIAGNPHPGVVSTMVEFDMEHGEALRLVASRYAAACVAANEVAIVMRADQDRLKFPGLGDVCRGTVSVPAELGTDAPLAFFEPLPQVPGASAEWPLSLFHHAPPGSGRDPTLIETDLTGRSRVLIYGPYIKLGPGIWRVDVQFSLQLQNATVDLRFEWGSAADVVSMVQSIGKSGIYRATLERYWAEPEVCEMRIWLDRAMFDGFMEINDCRVTYVARAASVGKKQIDAVA